MQLTRAMICALLVTVAACAPQHGNIAHNPINFSRPDAALPQVSNTAYRLNALDKFSVTIYRVPDLTRDYQVEPAGTVNFPLIGTIKVVGMSSNELEHELRVKYSEKYLVNPNISVQINEMTANLVTVEGSVRTPQVYNLPGESNLLEVIAHAAGPDDYANEHRVVVFRQINGQRQAAAFDLSRVREGLDPNPPIYGGDVIVVDGSTLKRGFRQVLQIIPIAGLFAVIL